VQAGHARESCRRHKHGYIEGCLEGVFPQSRPTALVSRQLIGDAYLALQLSGWHETYLAVFTSKDGPSIGVRCIVAVKQ
jgi:hypothetical protein